LRGQRLFVRPIESGDSEAIAAFYAANGSERQSAAFGLLGKLVGELAAVMAIEILPDALRIDDLLVRNDLRRKRIGRFLVEEAVGLAAKLDRAVLVVRAPAPSPAAETFLRAVGFSPEEGVFVRRVG
jgi:GNAT superfamily N-acetyltransferase